MDSMIPPARHRVKARILEDLTELLVGPIIKKFQYDAVEEKKYEIRNLILVIVTLIAAVTFQAGINPPGGLWQDDQKGQDNQNGHVAGTAILADRNQAAYYVFLVFNTLAFTTSTFIIFAFTQGFPFHLEIRLAILSIVATYGCAVFAITPPKSAHLAYIVLLALLPILVRSLVRLCSIGKEGQPENDSNRDAIDNAV